MSETQFQKDCKDEGYCMWANCHCAFREAVRKAQRQLLKLEKKVSGGEDGGTYVSWVDHNEIENLHAILFPATNNSKEKVQP